MITKTKLIVIFIGMITIWVASYFIHLYETSDSFKVENIPYAQIDTVKISEGTGNTIIIDNKDSILTVKNILMRSRMIDERDLNLRANTRLFQIVVHFKDNKSIDLDLLKTLYSGGILRSGDYYYQNTPLLNYVVNMLDSR